MMEDPYIEELKARIQKVVGTCWNCNFCFSVCPNYSSTRGFQTQGPSGITQSLYYAVKWNAFDGPQKKDLRDIVYACTLCNACVIACRAMSSGVSLLDAVEAGRHLLVEKMIGPLQGQGRCLESIYLRGNPYGKSPEKRLSWCRDLQIKRLPRETAEVLLFVGCAASYDPELSVIAKGLVRLFQTMDLDFGVLENEGCCGHPAKSLGDELLFQELAKQNLDKISKSGARTIVTLSPHCYHAFIKQYPPLDKGLHVQHYTEYLGNLITDRNPAFKGGPPRIVTYHDPCYLGKHHRIHEAPRRLIDFLPGVTRVEMDLSRVESLCCGGGGGRMFDDFEEERRLSHTRVEQALATGADVLATACPWCHRMLGDAVRDLGVQGKIEVMDIAELLAQSL